jgi:hypothetical protein
MDWAFFFVLVAIVGCLVVIAVWAAEDFMGDKDEH